MTAIAKKQKGSVTIGLFYWKKEYHVVSYNHEYGVTSTIAICNYLESAIERYESE